MASGHEQFRDALGTADVAGSIFVTVGAQMPFDRLVRTVDEWAAAEGRSDVFAQIGMSQWRPRHIQWTHFLSPEEFRCCVRQCRVMVAHAGTGSIIAAMEHAKPIIVMPRLAALGETRNDHQTATAHRFAERGIAVAMNESALLRHLGDADSLPHPAAIPSEASEALIRTIQRFISRGVDEPLSSDSRQPTSVP